MKKMTTEEFIQKSKENFGNKFKYTNTVCTGSRNPVSVTCDKHGDIVVPSARSHLVSKYGCFKCGKEASGGYKIGLKSSEKFKKEIIEVWGNRWDLSKTEWTGTVNRTIVICKDHGEFTPICGAFLRHRNTCPNCSPKKKKTDEEIKEMLQKVHGVKYGLNLVHFTRWRDDITMVCSIHGKFSLNVKMATKGSGCPDCGEGKFHTIESLKKKANKVHKNRYRYDRVEFNNGEDTIHIYCKVHKKYFSQVMKEHLRGSGCSDCFNDRNRITFEDFKNRSIARFGDIFKLRKDKYNGYLEEMVIGCSVHGDVSIIPKSFLRIKTGCPLCSGQTKWTIGVFKEKALELRGSFFNYEKIYFGEDGKVHNIYCNKHKKYFNQSRYTHLKGAGCDLCSSEKRFGENNGNYKDGRSRKRNKERNCPEYRQWKKAVLEKHTECDCCGLLFTEGIKKDAHHLNAWYSFPEDRFKIENGVALCEECHSSFHSEYENGMNTKFDYETFKEWRSPFYG